MAKDIKAKVKIQVKGGGATPALGSSLGQYGLSLMDFCKQFNAQTADKKGQTVPVIITIYTDRSFEFVVKTPPAAELIKKKINLSKGSGRPHDTIVGKISWTDIEDIAKIKMEDLNAVTIDQAKKIIAGSARSMGVEVVD
ncbi:50S ribosomal protein L11 [bacterium]|jgi:large subunit ribosomal protein L11|nr:50S ribosomal protein L11 [bacterium]MBT5015144.1 50S ribosomal protein L11 [bacterium]